MSDPIFQRSLQDLIKGIRSNKKDPSPFINKSIAEVKAELRSTDPFIKAEAVRKLTYLQMIGYNVSWASFSIVEVMSQPRFGHKRIGYLAANQSFDEDTDVILLTTNLYKKELSSSISMSNSISSSQYEIGVAINSLANIANKDLARDCLPDLVSLMNHSRPYIRKKAVLAMYKLYVRFPQGLRLTFDKLKERLDDSESSVVSTAVNVICELANKNPRNYLAMAPKFFKLLTTSSNNWMLIKVVKLLGSLVSEEPRLARKLLEPLSTIIQNTGAKSLQYECIYTVTEALPHSKRDDGSDAKNAPAVIKLCSDYLRSFIEDSDQNLKYLGLVGLVQLMCSSPRSVVEHRDLVLRCLNDDDVTIRSKALELLVGIVSRKSLVDLVHHLLEHARVAEGRYRDEIISKVLQMCKRDKYALVGDFAWYTSILLQLAVVQCGSGSGSSSGSNNSSSSGSTHGREVAEQLIEISLRVDSVREYAVQTMLSMLLDDALVLGQARLTVAEVLKAAAWIVGEYAHITTTATTTATTSLLAQDITTATSATTTATTAAAGGGGGGSVYELAISALLHPRATNLPLLVQSGYLHAAVKLFARAANCCSREEMAAVVRIVREKLPVFMQSQDLEIQERASTFRHLLSQLEILPMDWEASTVEVAKPGTGPAARAANKAATATAATGGEQSQQQQESGLDEKQQQIMDLLDLPVYTRSSVQAIDDAGAAAAIEKKLILGALCAETFYAVHSKAQRRVPVPEELALEEAFDESALQQLLSVHIPDSAAAAAAVIELVTTAAAANRNLYGNSAAAGGGSGFLSGAGAASALVSDSVLFGDNDPNSSAAAAAAWEERSIVTGTTAATGGSSVRNADSNSSSSVFMLAAAGDKHDAHIIPLSKLLGESFCDDNAATAGRETTTGGSKKDKKKKKKADAASAAAAVSVNVNEMLPAGALSGSDSESSQRQQQRKKKKNSSKATTGAVTADVDANSSNNNRQKRKSKKDDEEDLTNVDITTPLRADEQLQERQHRVVPDMQQLQQQQQFTAAVGGGDVEGGKKKKKSSKKKTAADDEAAAADAGEKKKKSSSSKSKKSVANAVDNLLDMPTATAATTTTTAAAAMQQQQDNLLGLDFAAAAVEAPVKNSKKSASGLFWQLISNDEGIEVYYAVTLSTAATAATAVNLHWRVVNNAADGSAASVAAVVSGSALQSTQQQQLATALAAGDSSNSSVEVQLSAPLMLQSLSLQCQLQCSSESLMGPSTRSSSCQLLVPVSAAFTPQKLDSDGFTAALAQLNNSKNNSSSGSASAQIVLRGKAKAAFKSLSLFLRAAAVEVESSKAASLAATAPGGLLVLLLLKAHSSNSTLRIDIKCGSSSSNNNNSGSAQMLADSIVQSLESVAV